MATVIALFAGHVGVAHASDPTTGDPVIAAVGDMSCAPEDSHFNGGAGQPFNCGEAVTSAQMQKDPTIDMLLGLGDYQYGCGDPAEYALSYNPTWGFFNHMIDPSVGNHEYATTANSATGTPCPDANLSADDYFNYFGAAAHPATAGEYSFNVGKWHLISLNAQLQEQRRRRLRRQRHPDAVADRRPGREHAAVRAGVLAPAAVDGDDLERRAVRPVVERPLPAPRRRRAERPHPHVRPVRDAESERPGGQHERHPRGDRRHRR